MSGVLITGAEGQLGRSLRGLCDAFVFTDVAQMDITDARAVDEAVAQVDFVVNCAAYTAVDKAESDEATARRINVDGVRNLAEACARHDRTLIHVSTDYVFDGKSEKPYRESDPVAPPGAYGRTKLAGEQAMLRAGCRGAIVRTAWLYSEYGHNFLKTMLRLGASQSEIRVVDDQFGSPTYAGDLAHAIVQMLPRVSGKRGEVYHYSNEGCTSWSGFAERIMELAGLPARIVPIATSDYPTPAARPRFSLLDKSKIISEFGLEIATWEASLKRCIEKLQP